MEYRNFNTITNEEIKFIINDLFNSIKIRDINRNKVNKDIVVDIFMDYVKNTRDFSHGMNLHTCVKQKYIVIY